MGVKNGIMQGAMNETKDIVQNAQSILRSNLKNPEDSTGTLEMSIVSDRMGSGSGFNSVFMVFTDGSAPYAGYVEEGHGKWGGHHFMQAAFKIAEENLAKDMASEIRASLGKMSII